MKRLLSLLALLSSISAHAATFVVNSTADVQDTNPGNGVCETAVGNGVCTLRAAFNEANILGGANTINVPTGTYSLTIGNLSTTNASNNLTVTGTGAAGSVIIDGGGVNQLLNLQGGTTSLNNLVLQNGKFVIVNPGSFGACEGAGIFMGNGTVNVTSSVITGNVVVQGSGGGICVMNAGILNLDKSSVVNNTAEQGGGGIRIVTGGTANITNSTISGNQLTMVGNGTGGGIESQGTLVMSNSTVSGNIVSPTFAVGSGVGLAAGTATLSNVTITANSGNTGQLAQFGSTVTGVNTIIANPVLGPNCAGTITSSGHNIDSANTCAFVASGDLINTNPMLGPLVNNGGPTFTHALLAGSPAIDAGAACGPVDQRAIARPQGAACDIGAYEFVPPAGIAPTITSSPPPAGTLGTPYNFTVTANGTAPITFTVTSGALPTGLSLSAAGVITGTPTSASVGPWTGVITATNGTLPNATQSFSIMIPVVVTPPPTVTSIPTLSEWGILLLSGLMLLFGSWKMRAQRLSMPSSEAENHTD